MLFDSELRPEQVELRTNSHLKLSLAYCSNDIIASDPSVAVVWLNHAGEHGDKCGFTSSVGPQQSKGFLIFNLEVETFDGSEITLVALLLV